MKTFGMIKCKGWACDDMPADYNRMVKEQATVRKIQARKDRSRVPYKSPARKEPAREPEAHSNHGYARPANSHAGNVGNDYHCSCCGASAYYDGRCGDGPVLTCGCDRAEQEYWSRDNR